MAPRPRAFKLTDMPRSSRSAASPPQRVSPTHCPTPLVSSSFAADIELAECASAVPPSVAAETVLSECPSETSDMTSFDALFNSNGAPLCIIFGSGENNVLPIYARPPHRLLATPEFRWNRFLSIPQQPLSLVAYASDQADAAIVRPRPAQTQPVGSSFIEASRAIASEGFARCFLSDKFPIFLFRFPPSHARCNK